MAMQRKDFTVAIAKLSRLPPTLRDHLFDRLIHIIGNTFASPHLTDPPPDQRPHLVGSHPRGRISEKHTMTTHHTPIGLT